jgi:hypothetical protein
VAAAQAAELAGADGIALDAHVGLQWAGFSLLPEPGLA